MKIDDTVQRISAVVSNSKTVFHSGLFLCGVCISLCSREFPPDIPPTIQRHAPGVRSIGHSILSVGVNVSVQGPLPFY